MTGKHPTLPNRYDWENKLVFYLTEDELPQFLYAAACSFGPSASGSDPIKLLDTNLLHAGQHVARE